MARQQRRGHLIVKARSNKGWQALRLFGRSKKAIAAAGAVVLLRFRDARVGYGGCRADEQACQHEFPHHDCAPRTP